MVGKGAPGVRLVACILHEALHKSPGCKSYSLPTLIEYTVLVLVVVRVNVHKRQGRQAGVLYDVHGTRKSVSNTTNIIKYRNPNRTNTLSLSHKC